MSIRSHFTRQGRFLEIVGCPQNPTHLPLEDEAACATCRFNVLAPGVPQMGCESNTSLEDYNAAMHHLKTISPNNYQTAEQILDRLRRSPPSRSLSDDELEILLKIVSDWWTLVGNDAGVVTAVSTAWRFVDGAQRLDEPVRIFS